VNTIPAKHARPRVLNVSNAILFFAAVSALFGVGAVSAEIPDGRALFPGTRAALPHAGLLLSFLLMAFAMLAAWYARFTSIREPTGAALRDMMPALLLAVPCVRTWLLHAGLNLPQMATTLMTPLLCAGAFVLFSGFNIVARLRGDARVHDVLAPRMARMQTDRAVVCIIFMLMMGTSTLLIIDEDRRNMIVGDEPSYLIIMESLRQFGTADVTRLYAEQPPLGDGVRLMGHPHITATSRPGTQYSVHHIGVSLLMLLPHWLMGFHGVMLFFAGVTSLAVCNLYLLNRAVSENRTGCAAVALLIGFSAPFSSYFRVIYPEPVAALFVLYGFRIWLVEAAPGRFRQWIGAAALAFLPWLHVKFLFLVLPLAALIFLFRTWPARRRKGAAAFAGYAAWVPFILWALSGAAMMAFFYHAFGNWKPDAQYRPGEGVHPEFVIRGLLGQLLDRDHGLLAVAPVYLLALPGLWILARRNGRLFVSSVLLMVTYLAGTAGHWMWWGGPCPPARFIMPALAFFTPCILLALEANRSRLVHALAAFFILIGAVASVSGMLHPGELTRHANVIYRYIPGLEAHPVLPCFYWHKNDPEQVSSYHTAAVIGALVIGMLVVYFRPVRKSSDKFDSLSAGFRTPFYFALILLLTGAVGLANHAFMMKDPHRFFEENILLARLKYPLDRYARPLARSGISPEAAHARITPPVVLECSLARWQQASSGNIPEQPRIFMSGPYTFLYPVQNTIRVDYEAIAGQEAGSPGFFEVTSDDGTRPLAQQDFDPAARQLSLAVAVDEIRSRVEFRASLTNSGSIRINGIRYTAQIGTAPSRVSESTSSR